MSCAYKTWSSCVHRSGAHAWPLELGCRSLKARICRHRRSFSRMLWICGGVRAQKLFSERRMIRRTFGRRGTSGDAGWPAKRGLGSSTKNRRRGLRKEMDRNSLRARGNAGSPSDGLSRPSSVQHSIFEEIAYGRKCPLGFTGRSVCPSRHGSGAVADRRAPSRSIRRRQIPDHRRGAPTARGCFEVAERFAGGKADRRLLRARS